MNSHDNLAIRVENLSKMYKIYARPSDMFWEMVSGQPRFKPFWALNNISFSVPRGSVVGIMGRNGAGKSTLLKIISGTLDKTSGEYQVKGRISSILELGTGFNLEYTGRQNVYLGGLMVGMTREEVNSKMDWIIEFSELGSVIDQTFKTYSTGMQARLTFSTAVCIEPDILIVDEALSVGDAKFARKCYAKIDEFRSEGRTILLVSHDTNTINNFCDHAVLLENGKILDQGKPYHISQVYYQLLFGTPDDKVETEETVSMQQAEEPTESEITLETQTSPDNENLKPDQEKPSGIITDRDTEMMDREEMKLNALRYLHLKKPFDQGSGHLKRISNKKGEILDYGILNEAGQRVSLLVSGGKYRFFSKAVFYEDVPGITSGFVIRNIKGVDLYGTSSFVQDLETVVAKKGTILESTCDVTMWLSNGIYFLSVALANPYAENDVQYDLLYDAYQFEVEMKQGIFTTSVVNLDAQPIARNIIWGQASFAPLESNKYSTIR